MAATSSNLLNTYRASPVVKRLRRLRRQTHQKNLNQSRRMRDEPEGNSIMQKSKQRIYVPQTPCLSTFNASSVSAMKKKKKHKFRADDINLDTLEDKYLTRKAKKVDISQTCMTFNSLNFTTSTTVGHSDTMLSQSTAISNAGARPKKADMSWENAVRTARGQPDGAERSFRSNSRESLKLSRVEEEESLGAMAKPLEEGVLKEETQPLVAKKKKISIKKGLKSAAKKLKSLKSRGSRTGPAAAATTAEPQSPTKRKINATGLTDETCQPETPKKKLKFEDLKRKDRKKMRKLMKNNSELIKTSKHVWEELRRHDLAEERRIELCDVLYKHVKGKVRDMAYAHDTARVIQCLIQFGDMDQKQIIFEELKDQIVPMSKSKYGKFVVRKILKYGTRPQKNFVFKAFHGNVRKLIRHREACDLVEYAYNEYANASQRLALLEEFYGPSFTLFKTFETKCLNDIMSSQPDKREMILSNMKEAILPLVDKSILIHSLVHRVIYEFFHYANNKMKSDMIEVLRESLVTMVHTRDGVRVAMQCVWHGSTKDRKVIIKSLKSHVVKVSKEEYGHMLLLAIFDVVDDTKIVQKALLEEMLKSVNEVAQDLYGRKVLIYLLSPRNPIHFHPDVVRILHEGDKNTTSKKETGVRHKELLQYVSAPLLEYIKGHARELVLNNATLLLLLTIVTKAEGDPTDAMEAIAKIAAEPFTAGSLDNYHIVEHPAGHLTLKRLIVNDKDRLQQGGTALFSQVLLKILPEGRLKSWAACNRGCFILLGLLELNHPDVTAAVKSQLSGVKNSLKKMTFKGSQILLQKLETD